MYLYANYVEQKRLFIDNKVDFDELTLYYGLNMQECFLICQFGFDFNNSYCSLNDSCMKFSRTAEAAGRGAFEFAPMTRQIVQFSFLAVRRAREVIQNLINPEVEELVMRSNITSTHQGTDIEYENIFFDEDNAICNRNAHCYPGFLFTYKF
jgi:hypothetical protein